MRIKECFSKTSMQDKQEIQKYVMKNLSFIIVSFAKIENFIITPDETDFLISDFLNNQLPTESQKISLSDFLMVIGIYKVYNLFFLNENPSIERCEFDFQDLQDVNGIIARYEDDRCGGIRQCPVSLRGIKNYTPPHTLNPILIKQEYKNILKEFEKLKKAKTIDIIDFICRTGAFLIKKQLFPNGNNRTMFFFMNILLKNAGLGFLFIPLDKTSIFLEKRHKFYDDDTEVEDFISFLKQNVVSIKEMKEQQIQNDSIKAKKFKI